VRFAQIGIAQNEHAPKFPDGLTAAIEFRLFFDPQRVTGQSF
jgi:hypothetical protein